MAKGDTVTKRAPWARARAVENRTAWYSITNKATEPRHAEVYVYDVIGDYGVAASDFVKALDELDVDTIALKLNSPGGDVFDGVAIHNALKQHPARVEVTVDALAASAASFIAMAGDSVHMARGAELMIHEAHALEAGDARTFTAMAERLERIGDKIAGFYAERAGGEVDTWRAAMRQETWYSGEEAVAAGLADTHGDPPKKLTAPRAEFDLSGFAHAGRATAPAPVIPAPLPVIPAPLLDSAPSADDTSADDPFGAFISALSGGGHQ